MTTEEKAAVDRTWEELNPDWLEMGDLTGCFAKSQFDDCPGCGRFEQLQVRDVSQDEQCVTVSCDECHFCSWGDTPSEAVENWNRRASLAALQSATERADRAEAALRKYADAKNWKCSLCVHDAEHVDGICCNDFFEPTLGGYEIARQALKESKDETR